MLSHVWLVESYFLCPRVGANHLWFRYAKDIKTALLAADIIVHNWGFKDFRLNIYGALDKAPTYSAECQEILACKSLRENVRLCGTADPGTVLANTVRIEWVIPFVGSRLIAR